MTHLAALFKQTEKTLSFEFFPPKDERAWYTLEDTIEQLVQLGPHFVSVTYGAGGSTRAKTREIIEHIQGKTGVIAMAHLTCVNATRAELNNLLDEYAAAGIRNLLALRGDPPKGQKHFIPTDGGCVHATDLIALIQQRGDFTTLCAAFPERHPEAVSREADWAHLTTKLSQGACAAITQMIFEPKPWIDMVAHVTTALGRKPRIIPGIQPITDFHAWLRFSERCGAIVPPALRARLEPLAGDRVAMRKAGIAATIELCRQLLEAGAPGLHLYAHNRSTAAAEIVTALRGSRHLD